MAGSVLHIGIADHLGWAVAVTATAGHEVVDRRRIELVDASVPAAPIHHHGGAWPQHGSPHFDDAALAALVARVRDAVIRVTRESFAALAAELPGRVGSISLREFAGELPEDIAALRRPPYESRADAVMYRRIMADIADSLGWKPHCYDSRAVVAQAAALLGTRTDEVLAGPRAVLGPPWTKDHRVALAATVLASG